MTKRSASPVKKSLAWARAAAGDGPNAVAVRGADSRQRSGAVAQLGERLNGIQEVRGSIPLSSTSIGTEAATVAQW